MTATLPLIITASGSHQLIQQSPQGLIQLPVSSALAQQLIAAKRNQTANQQLSLVTPQQLANQQSANAHLANQTVQIGQLTANHGSGVVQLGPLSVNQQGQLIQQAGSQSLQIRGQAVSLTPSLCVFLADFTRGRLSTKPLDGHSRSDDERKSKEYIRLMLISNLSI